jgi:hypothetical protein
MQKIIEALVRLILKAVFPELLDIAISVVEEIEKDKEVLTNEKKRKLAFKRIKEKLKESEKEAKDSLINLAIELAVNYLKGLKRD